MVKDGIYYGIAFFAAGALLWYLLIPAFAAPLFLAALFCLYFFRDPDRTIPNVEYTQGRFLVASREVASSQNERNTVTIAGDATSVRFAQIAGLIARRIVCYKKPGDAVAKGERVGLIKFGSRVDVFLGPEWEIKVQSGE